MNRSTIGRRPSCYRKRAPLRAFPRRVPEMEYDADDAHPADFREGRFEVERRTFVGETFAYPNMWGCGPATIAAAKSFIWAAGGGLDSTHVQPPDSIAHGLGGCGTAGPEEVTVDGKSRNPGSGVPLFPPPL